MFTILIQFGWAGFGLNRCNLVPEIRLGFLTVAWVRGSLLRRIQGWRDALSAARDALAAHTR